MSDSAFCKAVKKTAGNAAPTQMLGGAMISECQVKSLHARIEEMEAENRKLQAVADAARKVEASGVLCDPGCCGDECGCDDLRRALGRTA